MPRCSAAGLRRAGRQLRPGHRGARPLASPLVDALPLRPGDTVLDVGCGTGLCFPLLLDRIGPSGVIIGLDPAPEMLALAQAKVDAHGWTGVHLIEASAEEADIPRLADAALFSAVHDVLQSPTALDNVFGHLRPGAAVAAAGGKWPAPVAAAAVAVRPVPARELHPRLRRLRPAVAAARTTARRVPRHRGGARVRLPRDRPRARRGLTRPGRVVGPGCHGPLPLRPSSGRPDPDPGIAPNGGQHMGHGRTPGHPDRTGARR